MLITKYNAKGLTGLLRSTQQANFERVNGEDELRGIMGRIFMQCSYTLFTVYSFYDAGYSNIVSGRYISKYLRFYMRNICFVE